MKEDVYICYVRKNKMKNIRTNTPLRVLLLNDINGESRWHRAWYVSVRKIWSNKLTFLLLTLLLEYYNKKSKIVGKKMLK